MIVLRRKRSLFRRTGIIMYAAVKRIFTGPVFFLILALLLLLGVSFSRAVYKEEGFFRVSVYAPEGGAAEAAAKLADEPGVMRLRFVSSAEEARESVRAGTADAALIYSDDFDDVLARYSDGRIGVALRIVRSDDGVFASLAAERAYTAFFPRISLGIFKSALSRLEGRETSEEEALEYYSVNVKSDRLIAFEDLNSEEVRREYFAVAPVRGMLSLMIFFTAAAFSILSFKDERNAYFASGGRAGATLYAVFLILLPTLLVSLCSYATLFILGLISAPAYDLLALGLFTLLSVALCLFLRELFHSALFFGALLLPALPATLFFTPIFTDPVVPEALCLLFPTYHYLLSLHDRAYLAASAGYTAALLLLTVCLKLIRRRRGAAL